MNIRNAPIGMFGAVMGLVGLGLSARATATALPGFVRAPAYVSEPCVALGVLAFVVMLPLYLVKVLTHPDAVREEFRNPLPLGTCGTLPVAMFLVGGGIGPYFPFLGRAVWWAGLGLLVAFQVWALVRWLSGGIELAQVNAGWLIIMVGGIVAPGPGIGLGNGDAARFVFGVSAIAAPMLVALLFHRAIVAAPLPERVRPSWFVLLVPPSLIYANGLALYPGFGFLEALYFLGLVLAAALVVVSRGFLRWPFSTWWWAFTFPLDALAFAAARYAIDHPSALWRGVAGATLLAAAAAVLICLAQSLRSVAWRRA